MDTNDYILMCMERSKDLLHEYLKDLSLEEVCYQPSKVSNSISWIVWHTSRGFDRRISLLDGIEQLWMSEKWYEKYNLPASNKDLGIGHTTDDISKIKPSKVKDLINYYESINKKMIDFFNSKKSKDLNKKITETGNSQAHELMRMVTGTFQHWGQVNYIRGIIENRIWYTGNTKEKR